MAKMVLCTVCYTINYTVGSICTWMWVMLKRFFRVYLFPIFILLPIILGFLILLGLLVTSIFNI